MLSRGLMRAADPLPHTNPKRSKDGKHRHSQTQPGGSGDNSRKISAFTESRYNRWLQSSVVIYAKTGISDIGLFFQKFNNW
jgi:hypothetical protein